MTSVAAGAPMGTPLAVPRAFAIIEPNLFRSAIFAKECFPFVRHLNLKTIVYLSSEEPPKSVKDFCNEAEIVFMNLGTFQHPARGGDWIPLRGDIPKMALELVLDETKFPLMIMCLNGVDQTGALVGCLRKLQGWSFASIVEEHRRFCEGHTRLLIEHFVEVFDVDLVSPPKHVPEWFANDLEMLRAEEAAVRKERAKRLIPPTSSTSKQATGPIVPLPKTSPQASKRNKNKDWTTSM